MRSRNRRVRWMFSRRLRSPAEQMVWSLRWNCRHVTAGWVRLLLDVYHTTSGAARASYLFSGYERVQEYSEREEHRQSSIWNSNGKDHQNPNGRNIITLGTAARHSIKNAILKKYLGEEFLYWHEHVCAYGRIDRDALGILIITDVM